MAKFLRVRGIRDISPNDLDGHVFRLSLDIGEVVGTEFVPSTSNDVDVTISGTLQAMWGVPNSQVASPTGSIAAATVVDRVRQGSQELFQPISLTSFTGPTTAPKYSTAAPGSLIPIPEPEQKVEPKASNMQISSLSDDISAIRDYIHTLSESLLGSSLLSLPQERHLIDMYKEARSGEEFSNRIQSLAGLAVSLNKPAMLKGFTQAQLDEIVKRHDLRDPSETAPVVLLEELLTIYSNADRAKAVCDVFKNLNNLRQGYPTHGDNAKKILQAHDFFKLRYPVDDFSTAWDSILGRYFEAMKEMLAIIKDHRHKVASGG